MAKGQHDAFFAEAEREVAARSPIRVEEAVKALRGRLFAQQLDFLDDPAKFRTVLCPRRAGKSYVASLALVIRCLEQAECSVAFITLTLKTAKRILWGQLKKLDTEFELGIKWNNTELKGTFPNGSQLVLGGAESAADIDKYRGVPFDLLILDECKSFPIGYFDELIEEVLIPCLHDRDGQLVMMGTPGAILSGTFYEATGPTSCHIKTKDGRTEGAETTVNERGAVEVGALYRDKASTAQKRANQSEGRHAMSRPFGERAQPKWSGVQWVWSQHRWTMQDNIKIPKLWERALATKEQFAWADDDPRWLREYLGQWVADDGAFVYRYRPERNDWPEGADLPEGHEWRFIMGMDLGFDDDFDIEIAAWSPTCKDFYHVEGFASPGFTVADIAAKIREYEARYDFDVLVGDRAGLGKTILATLAEVYGIDVVAADKQEKRDHIELLNSDLMNGRCRIRQGSELARQMSMLQWDETGRKEDKGTSKNHACDAFVYLWRHCYHHFWKAQRKEPDPGSKDYWEAWMEASAEKAAERYRRRMEGDLTDHLSANLDDWPGDRRLVS